jgi:hypothetical protein
LNTERVQHELEVADERGATRELGRNGKSGGGVNST